jgi:GH18 family chitinase
MISKGAIASKLSIGVAFYGRGFTFKQGTSPAPFVPSTGGMTVGTYETNTFDFYDIMNNYATSTN